MLMIVFSSRRRFEMQSGTPLEELVYRYTTNEIIDEYIRRKERRTYFNLTCFHSENYDNRTNHDHIYGNVIDIIMIIISVSIHISISEPFFLLTALLNTCAALLPLVTRGAGR